MKRISALLAAVLILLTFSACAGRTETGFETSSGKNETETKSSENKADEENAVNFNGDIVNLTYEKNLKDMFYKENLTDFHANTVFNMCDLTYSHEGEVTYSVRIIYFEGKSIEDAMEGTESAPTDKTVNGLTYKYYVTDAVYSDKTLPCHTYVYNYDDTTYCIGFISEYDMTSLETVFMNNVRFAKAE